MPATKAKPISTDPVADARAAFEAAVLTSGVAVDEYRAWVDAHAAAAADLVRRSSTAARIGNERRTAYADLRLEARTIASLTQRIGADANTGTSYGTNSYTAEKHAQRLAAWITAASDYSGRQVHSLDDVLPLPHEPHVTPLPHTAPGAYSVEVQRVLDTATRG